MSETFKERMKRMRLRAGLKSQQAAADAIGCERGTVGMWEAPSSAVDSVGSEYLLAVAAAYRVQPGYINTGNGDDEFPWGGEITPLPQSQPVRFDPEILAATIQGLRERAKRAHGTYTLDDIENDPARFIEAYELFVGMVPKPVPDNAVPYAPQGAKQHGRGKDVPVSGTTGRKMGRTGGRKA